MGRRKLIRIDEEKCDGCGQCITACQEGAIALVDGKARLVSETYCDGLGACLGECPQGAIAIEEREAQPFDEGAVKKHLAALRGTAPEPPAAGAPARSAPPAAAPLRSAPPAAAQPAPARFTCPSAALRSLPTPVAPPAGRGEPSARVPSSLRHWPVQLSLVPPAAPFLRGADLLICADCVPFVVADFHRRYLAGRAVLVGCPKLDDLDHYRDKLVEILEQARPASLLVLRIEVPCCSGIVAALRDARDQVMPELPLEVHVIGIQGDLRRQTYPGRVSQELAASQQD